jgi:hypothetical protein
LFVKDGDSDGVSQVLNAEFLLIFFFWAHRGRRSGLDVSLDHDLTLRKGASAETKIGFHSDGVDAKLADGLIWFLSD